MLHDWLRLQTGQYARQGSAHTHVAVSATDSEAAVRGYDALACHHVSYTGFDAAAVKGLPAIDVPSVLLGRLAVDRSVQGQGSGGILLGNALQRIRRMSVQVGIRVVTVEALDGSAVAFCRRHGFTAMPASHPHLFLPLDRLSGR